MDDTIKKKLPTAEGLHVANVKPDQPEALKHQPFRLGCSTDTFPSDEIRALSERGHRMEALAAGTIAPTNSVEEHFLRVHREEVDPETIDEHAWVRLKGRREFEREQETAPPPPTPEDYGIIEWDKEKCWW